MLTGMAIWLKAETLMTLGKLHLRRKNYEEALRCYREVAQLRPQYATAFVQLGYCLAAVGRHRDALDAEVLRVEEKSSIGQNARLDFAGVG